MAKKKVRQYQEVSIDQNGKTYKARYYVESGTVTVEVITKDGAMLNPCTQAGGDAYFTATMLLRELVDAGKVEGL